MAGEEQEMQQQQQNEVTTEESEVDVPDTLYHAVKGNNYDAVQRLIREREDVRMRGLDGKTLLHLAISVNADPKIFIALLEQLDEYVLSRRDENGDSVLEMIYKNDYAEEAEEALKERVLNRIMLSGDEGMIKSLVISGWTMFWSFDDLKESEQLKDCKESIERLSAYKDKIDIVHKGIQDDDRTILELMKEDEELTIGCDRTGLPPVIKAFVLGRYELVEEIVQQFPFCLDATDDLGRSPLHYAAVHTTPKEEAIYKLIVDNVDTGAEDKKDKVGKTAADYMESQGLLDLSKVKERVLEILNNLPVTKRVKVQTEAEGHSEVTENNEDQTAKITEDEKEADEAKEQASNEENQLEEPEEISKEIPSRAMKAGPGSHEGQYLASTLGSVLTKALAEIAECRPWDPIEYLAHFLYKYHADMDYLQQQKNLQKEIQAENEEREKNRLLKEERQEEERQIKEEELRRQKEEAEEEERQRLELEEQQRNSKNTRATERSSFLASYDRPRKPREYSAVLANPLLARDLSTCHYPDRFPQDGKNDRAKEASLAHPPDLATVKEEENGEVETVVREKDANGQTELHKLAGQEGSDLMALLNAGYSLADRDAKYRTPRDIAEENGLDDNVEIFDSYLTDMIEGEKLEGLQKLMLEGYDKFSSVLEKVSTDGLPENVTTFISGIPEFQGKIKDMIKAVRSGEKRHVSQTLTRKSFALAKDNMGRTPLHNAVLYNHKDVTEYIAESFPSSLTARDTLNRTPVHYAAGLSDDLFDLLVKHGGNITTIDARGKTPADYKEDNGEITVLKEEAPGIEVTAPDNNEEEADNDNNDEENEGEKDNKDEVSENTEASKDPEESQSQS